MHRQAYGLRGRAAQGVCFLRRDGGPRSQVPIYIYTASYIYSVIHSFIHIWRCVRVCVCACVERERGRGVSAGPRGQVPPYISIYPFIFLYMHIHIMFYSTSSWTTRTHHPRSLCLKMRWRATQSGSILSVYCYLFCFHFFMYSCIGRDVCAC